MSTHERQKGAEMATIPEELVSGTIGNPRFEIDSTHPILNGASIRVQLNSEADAMNLLRYYQPHRVGPRREQPDIASDDLFCDAVIEAVRHWVATFPLFLVNPKYSEDCWDAFAGRPYSRCCDHRQGGWGVNNEMGSGLPARVWWCRSCSKAFAADPNQDSGNSGNSIS